MRDCGRNHFSAAAWLGSQANKVIASPSSFIGSLGVFALHLDHSRAVREAGITPTFVVSRVSPFKVEGNALEPLTPEARACIQGEVDATAEKFIAAVARGRGFSVNKVKNDFGRGRMLSADDARAAGLIDQIGSFSDAIGPHTANRSATWSLASFFSADAAARRRRLELLRL